MGVERIVIVGGGFAGATAAVQLARKIDRPLAISVVEPAERVGPGLAYGIEDPTYRLNAIAAAHSIDVADPWHFARWFDANGLRQEDPAALVASGEVFARRRDFGRYLAETVAAHAAMPGGTRIEHIRARAVDLAATGDGTRVTLDSGQAIEGRQVILATGNPRFRHPDVLARAANHPGVHLDPLRRGTDGVPPDARVLVLGAGLTALDVIAALILRGHRGEIVAISRHGLRPHPQPARIVDPLPDPPPVPLVPLDLLEGDLPGYVREGMSALELLRGVRRHAAQTEAMGLGWQAGFDAMALPLSRIWPCLPLPEQMRALRHLRQQYDAHRFRTPPMTDAIVRAAEAEGRAHFRTARLAELEPREAGGLRASLHRADGMRADETFDAVLNCTGFDRASQFDDPLLASLRERGALVPHPTGLGIVTDRENRVIDASGRPEPRIRAIGPLTAGMFGDPLGVFFISAQVHRLIPGLARELGLKRSRTS